MTQLTLSGLFEASASGSPQAASNPLVETSPTADPKLSDKFRDIRLGEQEKNLAPMLKAYLKTKAQFPDKVVLYQVGDFYEIFFDDAPRVAEVLQIRLTSRNKEEPNPIPMCGVPVHAIENYLPRLLEAGVSCVVVSQTEEEVGKKGMVGREISRIVTPGVRYQGDGLDEKTFNFLAALCFDSRGSGAVSLCDVSTGKLLVTITSSPEETIEVLRRFRPAEVILPSTLFSIAVERTARPFRDVKKLLDDLGIAISFRPFIKSAKGEISQLLAQFTVESSADEAGRQLISALTERDALGLAALQVLLTYVEEISCGVLPRLSELSLTEEANAVFIDSATRRNLEITETLIGGEKKHSLVSHIDYTQTPMGYRQLLERILAPSCDLTEINNRHEAVEFLVKNGDLLGSLREVLPTVRDLDRLATRISTPRATPRDLRSLAESLELLPKLQEILQSSANVTFQELGRELDTLTDVYQRITAAIVDEPPAKATEGELIRDGFDKDVDSFRHVRRDGQSMLAKLEQDERARSGISSLKVKYNSVFGYFIEVTKAHIAKVPDDFERKQTLVNAERFVTRALKDFEVSILSARSRQIEREKELFVEIRNWASLQSARVQATSKKLSFIDVTASFAELARRNNYCRPLITNDLRLKIVAGRHPVVEQVVGEHNFTPNDALLDGEGRRFAVLTGPNMGGKSTYLRQVGLIQLLAQAGSFVPAKSCELGIVDRIFTRIGAADDLTRGDSTFMVEMREAATIVKRATKRSLVLIDEIGRGTATTDGLAIASAIAEWLHDNVGCKTIFATHFHELTELPVSKQGAFCLSVGVIEKDQEVIFTHRIEERVGDRSYGIEVAKLAGLPSALIERGFVLLKEIEAARASLVVEAEEVKAKTSAAAPGKLKTRPSLVERQLSELEVNKLTPLEALNEISRLKQLLLERPDPK